MTPEDEERTLNPARVSSEGIVDVRADVEVCYRDSVIQKEDSLRIIEIKQFLDWSLLYEEFVHIDAVYSLLSGQRKIRKMIEIPKRL